MTMNWNIKLEMNNLISGLITKHSLIARMCFNFLPYFTKTLKYCEHRTLHTSTSPAMLTHKPKLATECNFAFAFFTFNLKRLYA